MGAPALTSGPMIAAHGADGRAGTVLTDPAAALSNRQDRTQKSPTRQDWTQQGWMRETGWRLWRDFGDMRKAWRHARLADTLRKTDCAPDFGAGFRLMGDLTKPNGLSRAFRYEADRLAAAGLVSETSKNFLILGQPRQYRKMLANPPEGFKDGYRIGLWVTEFDVFPPDWMFALEIVHEIWTPSTFSARAIRAVTHLPVKVVPHAVR